MGLVHIRLVLTFVYYFIANHLIPDKEYPIELLSFDKFSEMELTWIETMTYAGKIPSSPLEAHYGFDLIPTKKGLFRKGTLMVFANTDTNRVEAMWFAIIPKIGPAIHIWLYACDQLDTTDDWDKNPLIGNVTIDNSKMFKRGEICYFE